MTDFLRYSWLFFVALPISAAVAPPAPVALKPKVHVALDGRAIRVKVDDRESRINLEAYVSAAGLEEGKILFCRRTRGIMYLVIDLGGPSKIPEDSKHCGAGQEDNMVWIKLGRDLKLIEIQSTLYESCWQTIEADKGYKIHGDELDLRFTDFQSGHAVENWLHYNNRSPDSGFVVLKMN
jgi:hypothetical protein